MACDTPVVARGKDCSIVSWVELVGRDAHFLYVIDGFSLASVCKRAACKFSGEPELLKGEATGGRQAWPRAEGAAGRSEPNPL